MAKIRAPLLSLSGSGSIAKSIVFGSWRGIPYARQHVVPSNPRTTAQTTTRNTFSAGDDMFKKMLALAQAPWSAAATGQPFTARNAFIRDYVKELRGDADMTDLIMSPGVNGGLAGTNFSASGGASAGEIDAQIDVNDVPVNWTVPSVTFVAVLDHDPATLLSEFVTEVSEDNGGSGWTPPVTVSTTITGLQTGQQYLVAAFPVWTRADGVTAYGPSVSSVVAAT